ncbi:hypothetical protein D3C73_1545050 [compost metagenome]
MLEQRLAGGRQFVALRVLHEKWCAQAFLDALDMPGNRAMGRVEPLGSAEQAATALQLEEKPQIIPVEHASFPCFSLC